MFRFLFACGFAMCATGAGRAEAPPWEERHDLTAADFAKASKELAEKGYRPTQICGFAVGKDARFTAVWEKQADAPEWEARHDLTAKQYETTAAELKEKGFRPVELCGYEANGEARFAAIWEKTPKDAPAWEAHPALTSDEYRKRYAELVNKGYRPLRVSGYAAGKETRYAIIWEKAPKDAVWHTRRDLTADQYQDVFNEQVAKKPQKPQLIQVSGYTVDGEERFAGVWAQFAPPAGRTRFAKHMLDAKQYEAVLADFKAKGFRPVQVSGYSVGGKVKYAGIWVKE